MNVTHVAAAAVAFFGAGLVHGDQPLTLDSLQQGSYVLDSKETLVRYSVNHFGVSEYWGTFPGATGTLVLDPKALSASTFDVKVPIALVETTNRELNGELFSDEFFDAENYPSMHFSSTQVTRTGPTTLKVYGDLTMHNITRPIVLDVTLHGAGIDPLGKKLYLIGFDAKGTVKRSDFGMGKYVPLVSDETGIIISAAFHKQ